MNLSSLAERIGRYMLCMNIVMVLSIWIMVLSIWMDSFEQSIQMTVRKLNDITKTCPCNIQRIFWLWKMKNFRRKIWIFFFILLNEAVLMSTHNLCFGSKIRKKVYPCIPQFYYIKVGYRGVNITRTCYHDEDQNG